MRLTAGASDVVDTEALDLSRVSSSIGTFSGEYTDMDFQKVYAFKNSLTAEIQQLSSSICFSSSRTRWRQLPRQAPFICSTPRHRGWWSTDGWI